MEKQIHLITTNQGTYLSVSVKEVEIEQLCLTIFRGMENVKIKDIVEIDVGAFRVVPDKQSYHYGKCLYINDLIPKEMRIKK